MMFKKLLFVLICFLNVYGNSIVNMYLVRNDAMYLMKDMDIVFQGDKIKFDFSNGNTKVSYQINDENIKAINTMDFKNEFLVFDAQKGKITFLFSSSDKNQSITFVTNPDYLVESSINQQFIDVADERVYIDSINIISNHRGVKEANIVIPKLESSTVIVNVDGKIGAGIIIDNNKFILTNYHIIEENEKNIFIALKPQSGNKPSKNSYYKVKVIKVDMQKDLALLEMPNEIMANKNLSSLKFGDFKKIKKGIDIYNIGHPLGYYFAFESGMLNNILNDYSWTTHQAKYVLQYSMNANKGNSGSPIVNEKLELIGIGAFSNTQGKNLNFAISIFDINEFMHSKQSIRLEKKSPDTYKKDIFQQGMYKDSKYAKLDRNNNGIADAMMKDIDNDGMWDAIAYDTDEDGSYERVTSF